MTQRTPDDEEVVTVLYGIYTDRHVRTEAGWRICERRLDSVHLDGTFLDPDQVRQFPEGKKWAS